MSWVWLCVLIVIGILLLCLCFSLVVFMRLCGRRPTNDGLSIARYYPEPQAEEYRNRLRDAQKRLASRPHEPVSITSEDGLVLSGAIYPADEPSDRWVLFCHGYHGTGLHDFCQYSSYWLSHGFNALVIDERAQGLSDGTYITLGAWESRDCLGWVDFLVHREPEARIALFGQSMGAAVVLSVADRVPPQVRCIVGDCGFTRLREEFNAAFRFFHLPAFPLGYMANMWSKLLGHFTYNTPGPIDALPHARVPVMLAHGSADPFVPVEMSIRNRDACPTCDTLLVVEGAAHAGSHLVDPGRYEETLDAFLRESFS